MSRPLRLEFPGSYWHITHRGNERRPTFYNDADRVRFLDLLGEAVERFKWIVTAYALMLNHFHLLLELCATETLSRGMQWLDGKYVGWFNRQHDRVGHLYQGRFKSILIDQETYALEVSRYVVLNPVRASLVARPDDCIWTSYPATAGQIDAPEWLAVDDVLSRFAGNRRIARALYRQFVAEGIASTRCPWDDIVGEMYLGPADWLERVRDRVECRLRPKDHVRAQRELLRPTMSEIVSVVANVMRVAEKTIRCGRGGFPRMVAAWIGCYEGILTNGKIGATLRLRSDSRVTELIAHCEAELRTNARLRQCIDRCLTTLRRKNRKLKL